MTPKEKAQELYWKYYQKVADSSYPEDLSKQCALIAVYEIMKETLDIYFWKEVKQEIQKL
jgi:hypothetical protein